MGAGCTSKAGSDCEQFIISDSLVDLLFAHYT